MSCCWYVGVIGMCAKCQARGWLISKAGIVAVLGLLRRVRGAHLSVPSQLTVEMLMSQEFPGLL